MRKFTRGDIPACLAGNWEGWGITWETRRRASASAEFRWPIVGGILLNQLLLPFLKAQTQSHCSFCDAFPVDPPSIPTIEHFRPKSRFPKDAYAWGNLYFCCMYCQQKSDDFHEAPLQPDALDYAFDRFFRWDFTLGTIEINERASFADQERARQTIQLYRLNEGHPKLRKLEARRRVQGPNDPLDEFAYRDFVSPPQSGDIKAP